MRKGLAILFLIQFVFSSSAQQPKVLKYPDNWSFEYIKLPPVFASGLNYKGFEEIRFAPGFYNPDSADYFAYVLAFVVNDVKSASDFDFEAFFKSYYIGLTKFVCDQRNITFIDMKIEADFGKGQIPKTNKGKISGTINTIGVFGNLENLELIVKINYCYNPKSKELRFISSIFKRNAPANVSKKNKKVVRNAGNPCKWKTIVKIPLPVF